MRDIGRGRRGGVQRGSGGGRGGVHRGSRGGRGGQPAPGSRARHHASARVSAHEPPARARDRGVAGQGEDGGPARRGREVVTALYIR
eukprot:1198462-Pyramimonas_sp.AAC.1